MKREFSEEEKQIISKLVDAYYEDLKGKISKERLKKLVEETYLESDSPEKSMFIMYIKIQKEIGLNNK